MSEYQPAPAVAPAPPAPRGNPWGLSALIVGIVAILGSAIPIVNNVSIVLGFVAVILAIIGFVVKYRKRGLAIAGVILGGLAIIIGFATQALYGAALNAVSESISSASATAFDAEHKVVVEVTGDGTATSITYSTQGGSEQATDAALPFKKELDMKGTLFGVISATNGGNGTTVTCTVTVDGKQVSTNTATGEYGSATCNYND